MSSIGILKAKQIFDEYGLFVNKVNDESTKQLREMINDDYKCPLMRIDDKMVNATNIDQLTNVRLTKAKLYCPNCILNVSKSDKYPVCGSTIILVNYKKDRDKILDKIYESSKTINMGLLNE